MCVCFCLGACAYSYSRVCVRVGWCEGKNPSLWFTHHSVWPAEILSFSGRIAFFFFFFASVFHLQRMTKTCYDSDRDQVKWMCLSAPPRTGEDSRDAVPFRDTIRASRPLSLSERPRNWETSAQWGRDHTWCTAVIIPVCVLWVKITADTGMSHHLKSHAERQKKWGESCRQILGVPPFVFSCQLRCLEVDELNGNWQLEVTL